MQEAVWIDVAFQDRQMGWLQFTGIVLRSFYFGKQYCVPGEYAEGQTVTHEEHRDRDLSSYEHLSCTQLK